MLMLRQLWHDEGGSIVSPEVCVIGGILVIGLVVGISALQTAMNTEIEDVGDAIESFDFTPELVPIDNNSLTSQDGTPPQNKNSLIPLTADKVISGQ
jgi:hypothetical protein